MSDLFFLILQSVSAFIAGWCFSFLWHDRKNSFQIYLKTKDGKININGFNDWFSQQKRLETTRKQLAYNAYMLGQMEVEK